MCGQRLRDNMSEVTLLESNQVATRKMVRTKTQRESQWKNDKNSTMYVEAIRLHGIMHLGFVPSLKLHICIVSICILIATPI